MKTKEFFDDTPVMDETDEVDTLETGPQQYIEEKNHEETIENIERKVLSIQQKIEAVKEALNVLTEAYEDSEAEERTNIRNMAVSADWALHRAEHELVETLGSLGVIDLD
jgi:septal ring factor EnvC (AmiA/AmiB activator)